MTDKAPISDGQLVRLLLNLTVSGLLTLFSLPMAFTLAIGLYSMSLPRPDDPDGPKAIGLAIFGIVICGFIGVGALIELIRAVRKLWPLFRK